MPMPIPLYRVKAEFFRVLGHPVRIRVLELLCDGPEPVRDLLADPEIASLGVSASSLSQQLAVLRRYGIVTTTRDSGSVVYMLAGPDVSDLMMSAR
ncbi:MAG TPA: metalloregulator ArsR/SmtB family transcription factor, partial [Actinospica sp.]|nr:metalloregulator ArsR/SmtB family transcription factor [Actinospica sp.]